MKKHIISDIMNLISKLPLALAIIACMASCDSVIYDYEGDCDPGTENPGNPGNPQGPQDPQEPEEEGFFVKFVFDMNMQFVDAFSQKVKSVKLFVFQNGSYIKAYEETNAAVLSDPAYLMDVSDLSAGTYELLAWCGLEGNKYFTVPLVINSHNDADCTMTVVNGTQSDNLLPLFHGLTPAATYTAAGGKQVAEVRLTKDTNNINVTIQHQEGLEFERNRFSAKITDNNGYMRYNNDVPADNEDVEYLPHRTVYGKVSYETKAETVGNYLQFEFATNRLMEGHDATLAITDNEAGHIIFSFPVIEWALKLRSANYKSMPEQEYLDRQDEYNLLVLLKNDATGDGWIGAEIRIIDWHVIDDSSDIK